MRKYQIRTEKDLEAFRAAVADAGGCFSKYREFCDVANTTMLANATHPDALTFGMAAVKVSLEGLEAAMQRVEAQAIHFLREPRKVGEDPCDYFVRLVNLIGDSRPHLKAVMVHRGLKLKSH